MMTVCLSVAHQDDVVKGHPVTQLKRPLMVSSLSHPLSAPISTQKHALIFQACSFHQTMIPICINVLRSDACVWPGNLKTEHQALLDVHVYTAYQTITLENKYIQNHSSCHFLITCLFNCFTFWQDPDRSQQNGTKDFICIFLAP